MARLNATGEGTVYEEIPAELLRRGLRSDDGLLSTGGQGYVQHHGRIDVEWMLARFKSVRGADAKRFHAASGGLIMLGA